MIIALAASACGGGGSSTPSGSGTPVAPTTIVPGSIGATISITASGPVPSDVRIEPTQRVRFVNNDSRPHQIQTNPHNFHTDCPPNNVTVLNPGQTVDSAIFSDVKACGYHDHLLPDEQKYWGTIRVGTNSDDKGPVYSRGW
jgi:plastocyanin